MSKVLLIAVFGLYRLYKPEGKRQKCNSIHYSLVLAEKKEGNNEGKNFKEKREISLFSTVLGDFFHHPQK